MNDYSELDIYQRLSRNRLRLAIAVSACIVIITVLSGLGLYLLYTTYHIKVNFWMVLILFWLFYMIYAILRYAFGGMRSFKDLKTLPSWKVDHMLNNAVGSVLLAFGMAERVRLLVMPHAAINAFSLSLPDGSYALFATQGIADKLPLREQEAIMAHEIAHMQVGDTLLHTVMIRLLGPVSMKKLETGWEVRRKRYTRGEIGLPAVFALIYVGLVLSNTTRSGGDTPAFLPPLSLCLLFLALASALPLFMHKLLQLAMDREREYYADLQAVFHTRDPEAVYQAIESSAEDVRDVLLLPSYLDALLFHPVVDYTSYRPFRTQPTMMDRARRLREAFPQVDT
jgi:Zn-dependent protease with chaperone function